MFFISNQINFTVDTQVYDLWQQKYTFAEWILNCSQKMQQVTAKLTKQKQNKWEGHQIWKHDYLNYFNHMIYLSKSHK